MYLQITLTLLKLTSILAPQYFFSGSEFLSEVTVYTYSFACIVGYIIYGTFISKHLVGGNYILKIYLKELVIILPVLLLTKYSNNFFDYVILFIYLLFQVFRVRKFLKV